MTGSPLPPSPPTPTVGAIRRFGIMGGTGRSGAGSAGRVRVRLEPLTSWSASKHHAIKEGYIQVVGKGPLKRPRTRFMALEDRVLHW